MAAADVATRLERTPGLNDEITPRTLREEGVTEANTPGERSLVGSLTLDTPVRLRSGRSNRFKVALPAFEKLGPTDATADNSETFNLANDVIQSPNTQDVVVYLDGEYYGAPDAVDYAADSIDVTDSGTASDVYVWYMTADPATVSIYKKIPNAETSASQRLWTNQLARLHKQDQQEQPEYFQFGEGWKPYLSSDMKLNVYVDAPFEVRFEDPDGHGNTPTNALFHIPVEQAQDTVPGLINIIKASMGR